MFSMLSASLEMIKKNFKVLLRSKSSALIILLGPFLIILLLGLAFNSSGLHSVRIGVYAPSYTSLSENLLSELTKNDFIIVKVEAEQACIDLVKEGGAHLCMVLPGELSTTAQGVAQEITFHVDYSKVNLVFTILNVISHEVESLSSDLSLEYTKALLEVMNSTAAEIQGKAVVIEGLQQGAVTMKDSLVQMKAQLQGLSIDTNEFGLSGLDAQLQQSQEQLQQFKQLGQGAVSSGLQLLDGIETYIDSFDASLSSQTQQIQGFQSTVGNYAELVCAVDFSSMSEELTFNPCGDLQDIQGFIEGVLTQTEQLSEDFEQIKGQIDDARDTLRKTQQGQTQLVGEAQTKISALSQQLTTAEQRVETLQGQKDTMVKQLDDLIVLLDTNVQTIGEIKTAVEDVAQRIQEGRIDSAEGIVNPILTRIKPVIKKRSYLDYTLPSLVVLVVMFMSMLLSTTMVMGEKSSHAYFRNFITPTRSFVFINSVYLTNILIVLVQGLVLLLIAQFAFHVSTLSQLPSILVALLILTSVFILLGMGVGYLFSSEETGTLASLSLSCVFLLFSSFLIPLESLSKTISVIAQFNPFVLGENILRGMLIFDTSFALSTDVLLLLLYIIVLYLFVYLSQRHDLRKFI